MTVPAMGFLFLENKGVHFSPFLYYNSVSGLPSGGPEDAEIKGAFSDAY